MTINKWVRQLRNDHQGKACRVSVSIDNGGGKVMGIGSTKAAH